jgi:twinkle protein
MSQNQITAAEISRRLAERAETVCQMLLSGGRIVKTEWWSGDTQGGAGDSLKVHLSGPHAGTWRDWSSGEHGDLIDLWRASRNVSRADAFRQVKEYLGIHEAVSPAAPKVYAKPPEKNTPPPRPEGLAARFLTGVRKITAETQAQFNVGTDSRAIVFPCHAPTGELVNRSYRTIPSEGEKKKVWQDTECAPCLFGWQALPESAYQSRTVLLAEGQIDAMTWHQWGIPALSIPAGSGQTWINYEWDNLAIFDKILIAFDSDEAGQTNAEKAIKRLGPHRCHLVSIPHKDANEALQAGKTALDAQQWASGAKAPFLSGVVSGLELHKRLMAEVAVKPMPSTIPIFCKGWENEAGLYFREGEVTLWTGVSGNGKSTFLAYLATCFSNGGLVTFHASMELKAETVLRKMGTVFWGECGVLKNLITSDQFTSWLMEFGDKFCFADRMGHIESDELFQMMDFSFRRFGATHFMIDSLMRVAGLEENAPALGEFMNRLSHFAKTTGAHIHLVAHPRKMAVGQRAGTSDIKGSSLIGNNADNIVGIARNQEKWDLEKEGATDPETMRGMHDTEITVEKQRESGWTGTFYLDFDPRRLTYKESKSRLQSKPKPEPKKSWASKKDW